MIVPASVRRSVKAIVRPFAMPLLRRLRSPFDFLSSRIERLEVLVPRIERLERQLAAAQATYGTDPVLRGTLDNLTRTWLRLQNEVSCLASCVPTSAAAAAQTRIEAFETRLQAMEHGLRELASEAASSEPAECDRHVDDKHRVLLDRIECLRRELMFELRDNAGNGTGGQGQLPRILSPGKIAAAHRSALIRLNLGCGRVPLPDYINVDLRDLPGVDIVADTGVLPFDPASIDEIFCSHLIELYPEEEIRRRLLPYWRTMLRPGGSIRAITSDGEAMLARAAQGTFAFENFHQTLFDRPGNDGDAHHNLFTPDSLRRLMEAAGFVSVEVPVRGRPNGRGFEFELVARVPEATAAD